ncbi:MAG: anthranilate synthase component I family protein [Nitrospira sp.]|nr:anthranilate synthase component I family protein [Nitrospira sp.]MBS0177513.1 anthranilate synthase component I family protein [Nitrospira sp.]
MTDSSQQAFLDGPPQPLIVVRPQPDADPFELYRRLASTSRPSFLLESANGSRSTARYSFFGSEPYLTLSGRGQEHHVEEAGRATVAAGSAFEALGRILGGSVISPIEGIPPFFGGAVGYLSYDLVRSFESLPSLATDDVGLPDMHLACFDLVAAVDHLTNQLYLMYCPPLSRFAAEPREKLYREGRDRLAELEARLTSPRPPATFHAWPRTATLVPNQSREAYTARVRRCQDYIGAGDIYQANLSHRFTLNLDAAAPRPEITAYATALYGRLRDVNPSPFAGLLHLPDLSLVSNSPERLVRLSGSEASTRPIAGTRPRGAGAQEDQHLHAELLASPKERAEHVMLVDLERNDLGKVCRYGTVQVNEFMTVEQYSHVRHLVSDVTGILKAGTSPLDLVRAVFPGGTITGVPKLRCMEVIEELEPVRRGIYTGALGYFCWSGDLDLNILIRTLLLTKTHGYLQVGAGIVADSDPDREYEETLAKAGAFFNILEAGR